MFKVLTKLSDEEKKKIWKKDKLNSEKIWKIWKKNKLKLVRY
jgi:hypothetical protein